MAFVAFFCIGAAVQAGSVTFRVMSFNIHHAEGIDTVPGVIDTQRIADLILQEKADLVGLQEVDVGTTRVSGRNLIAELAQQTGMDYVFSNNYNYQGGQYGNGILSRFPIVARDHRLLPNVAGSEQRGWLKAVVDVGGGNVSFWVTHLSATSTNLERLMCVTNFNAWLPAETVPVIFTGDFNDNPASTVHSRMATFWNDLWSQVGAGFGYTIPANSPNKRIDYIWTGNATLLQPGSAWVPVTSASDHRPVVAEMTLTLADTNPLAAIYFPLNEGSGTNLAEFQNRLAGTLGSSAPVWTNSTPTGFSSDRALDFSANARAIIPDPARAVTWNGTNGDYTLQTWVKLPAGFNPAARMVMFQNEGYPGFSFSVNTGRTLHTTAFGLKDLNSTTVVPNDGQWHHAAVVHQSGVEMRFYLDGVLDSTVAYTNGSGSRTSYALTVGGAGGTANSFTGALDRIRYAPWALTAQQLDSTAVPSAPVSLQLRHAEEVWTIFWPAAEAGYVLEATDNLASNVWTFVASTSHGQEHRAVISPLAENRFFRLRRIY